MKCSICGKEILGYGNNPAPICRGEVCDECNLSVILPIRMFLGSGDNNQALVLKDDDRIDFIKPVNGEISLKQLQDAVGGLIQFYPIQDSDFAFICNEEGLLLGLRENKLVCDLMKIKVVGNLVLLPKKFLKEG